MTEPTPSETALSAEEEAALRRFAQSYGDGGFGGDIKRLLATLDAARASRSATEESLRAALDECRQHHADTLAGNERGQHRSATEGRRNALPNDGRCAAQAETIHGWVQCTKPPLHEDRHVWGDDNRVTPAEPFA